MASRESIHMQRVDLVYKHFVILFKIRQRITHLLDLFFVDEWWIFSGILIQFGQRREQGR